MIDIMIYVLIGFIAATYCARKYSNGATDDSDAQMFIYILFLWPIGLILLTFVGLGKLTEKYVAWLQKGTK